MAVTYVTLYPPGGNSTQVQVVEGSQLHLIYASMGFSATPSTPGPPVRPDPFPYYVNEDELAAAGIGASDASVAALVGDDASQTGVALRAAFGAHAGTINAALDFGLSPTNTASDNADRLADAIAAAIAGDYEVYAPAGVYPIDPGIAWNAEVVRFRGAGSKSTVWQFASNTDHGFVLGDGASQDLGEQGWVKHMGFNSVPGRPAVKNYKAAVQLSGLRFATIDGLWLRGWDVGIDMINNCYGTDFHNIAAMYAQNHVALRIRPSTQNGNDHNFWNCWLGGRSAAVWIEADAASGVDGLHFYGGQLSSANGADYGNVDQDTFGAVTIGKNYETGVAEGDPTRITFTGTTFEGVHRVWAIRAFRPVVMDLHNVGVNFLDSGASAALGLFKNDLPYNDRVSLINTRFNFAQMKTAIIATPPGGGANPVYQEIGTFGTAVVGGVAQDLAQRGILDRAGLSRGIALAGRSIYLDGLRLRHNGAGAFEKSTDGTTWSAV